MKTFLAFFIAIATFIMVMYICIWWGIIEPILIISHAIDTDTVTASLIGWEVCKFFLKEIFAAIVAMIGFGISKWLIE